MTCERSRQCARVGVDATYGSWRTFASRGRRIPARRYFAQIVVISVTVACGESPYDNPVAPTTITATITATITGITISPSTIDLDVAGMVTLTATASYSDGTSAQLSDADWSSSNATVASVDTQGTVTGHARGTVTITALYDEESAEASVNVTLASRSVDARFNEAFWSELVYGALYGPLVDGSTVLNTTSPNLYIRMGDPTGRRVVSFGQRDHMRRWFPRLVEQMTGEPYRGRIEDGISDRVQSGWITVRFVTYEEEPEIAEGACARTNVGALPGSIYIIRRARGNKLCVDERWFPQLFAGTVGMALGFWKTSDPAGVMTNEEWWLGPQTFSSREQYHGQLAYEIGRGAPNIGWPLPLLETGFDQQRSRLSPIFSTIPRPR